MPNKHQADIDTARREIRQAESGISDHQQVIADLDEKVERLKEAKKVIEAQESEASKIKYQANQAHSSVSNWRGSNYDTFQSTFEDQKTSLATYCDGIDTVKDELNNEIARLENEQYDSEGVIGWLKSKINSLGNAIGNWLN